MPKMASIIFQENEVLQDAIMGICLLVAGGLNDASAYFLNTLSTHKIKKLHTTFKNVQDTWKVHFLCFFEK